LFNRDPRGERVSTPMADSINYRKGSPVAIAFAVFLLLLFVYILSSGPVLWLNKQIHAGPSEPADFWLKIVYAPLAGSNAPSGPPSAISEIRVPKSEIPRTPDPA